LGAPRRSILANVIFDGVIIAMIGVVSGGLIGAVCARLIGKYVSDVQLPGMVPLLASALLILVAAVVASAMPAARAARVNAAQALRSE
jgi:ABC-type antimicrobial peptide transport system permease subunit